MFRPAVILACGLAALAGCTTAPRHPSQPARQAKARPPDWESVPPEKSALPAPVVVAGPPAQSAAPVTPSSPRLRPLESNWLSLNRWRAARGLGEIRRRPVPPLESFALPTPGGMLILTAGSRAAYWEGLELRLGFAPQMIDGELFIHALDARKNFEPLLGSLTLPAKPGRVVVIDPGHGGANLGARSIVDGRLEKEFTLDWARRLAPLLEERGWQVVLTRANDVDVSLAERVAIAERRRADLFLSLHFNSREGGGHEPGGLETYCLTPTGMASHLTRGFPDDPRQEFPNNAHDEQNLQYAARLHRALLAVNGDADRGVRRARFPAVLRGQNRPAVLIEGGYLTNPTEARRIGDPAHRQKLAEAIAKALE